MIAYDFFVHQFFIDNQRRHTGHTANIATVFLCIDGEKNNAEM